MLSVSVVEELNFEELSRQLFLHSVLTELLEDHGECILSSNRIRYWSSWKDYFKEKLNCFLHHICCSMVRRQWIGMILTRNCSQKLSLKMSLDLKNTEGYSDVFGNILHECEFTKLKTVISTVLLIIIILFLTDTLFYLRTLTTRTGIDHRITNLLNGRHFSEKILSPTTKKFW